MPDTLALIEGSFEKIKPNAIALGVDWTPAVAEAWLEAYQMISAIMLEGTEHPEAYLNGELTFYEWLDLYGEMSPSFRKLVESTTHFKYGVH